MLVTTGGVARAGSGSWELSSQCSPKAWCHACQILWRTHQAPTTSGTSSTCTLMFLSKTPPLAFKASKRMLNNDPGLIVELLLLISKTSSVKKWQGCKGHQNTNRHSSGLMMVILSSKRYIPSSYTCSKHVRTIRIFITFLHHTIWITCRHKFSVSHCTCMHMYTYALSFYSMVYVLELRYKNTVWFVGGDIISQFHQRDWPIVQGQVYCVRQCNWNQCLFALSHNPWQRLVC